MALPVKGICMEMCPREEKTMRKSKKLVHQLECAPYKMVKCFSRSAAGSSLNKPHILRPPSVLKNTISYLLNEILTITNIPFNIVYDFIDDRLNSIKQDATIQEVSDQDWMAILPPIIRFHAYAAYKCYEYDVNTFDPFLNMKHFHESIFKIVKIFLQDLDKATDKLCSEMVSLLIVANLGDFNVLQQALPFITKKSTLIKMSVVLSLNIMNGNFGQLFETYNTFPVLHQCVISVQLPMLRKIILKSMCAGFNCKNNYFAISNLTKMLLHNKPQETIKECQHYCLTVIDNKVELSKSSFDNEVDKLHLKKKILFNVNVSTIVLNI
ncbi:germinal-center associated nuclear protein-like [Rhopalosiphum maidis]|uniref:germinal-center associated nuclear protein-like n=1 Tax=Rhopalosiphum maidis TaxID=43146 RepID=UPI000EFE426B|nr:germinal-center associated nuclear protein-like [Rhopalosiphum maidis]XP_026815339.1 germinal-center associated nuclear protein-like [Rhopalosiphum maidis]XP_026815340.1 germinal-center associated nuclear protein-like [Rhopalosiphum maidis]XP_026815341.1 germinal-center associated nuclear protein-like [Rhopalosiphum maidis]XP_026815342.1 germinal-center associated nuclear protein-like [Rhopalosiphum maidis]XP_026815343.1 germinal-center associated nuclear protein-like [Rhopalosiphum maidis]